MEEPRLRVAEGFSDEELGELKEFAEESGFEIESTANWNTRILLPLGEISGIEYGVCLDCVKGSAGGRLHYTVLGYVRYGGKDDRSVGNEPLECYTLETVVRTLELGDKTYVIEKQEKDDVDEARGLIYAFKFKELGTLDPRFISEVYQNIIELLPKDIANELIDSKLSGLEEKLDEVISLASEIPGEDYINIGTNIVKEFFAYVYCAVGNPELKKHLDKIDALRKKDPELAKAILGGFIKIKLERERQEIGY